MCLISIAWRSSSRVRNRRGRPEHGRRTTASASASIRASCCGVSIHGIAAWAILPGRDRVTIGAGRLYPPPRAHPQLPPRDHGSAQAAGNAAGVPTPPDARRDESTSNIYRALKIPELYLDGSASMPATSKCLRVAPSARPAASRARKCLRLGRTRAGPARGDAEPAGGAGGASDAWLS